MVSSDAALRSSFLKSNALLPSDFDSLEDVNEEQVESCERELKAFKAECSQGRKELEENQLRNHSIQGQIEYVHPMEPYSTSTNIKLSFSQKNDYTNHFAERKKKITDFEEKTKWILKKEQRMTRRLKKQQEKLDEADFVFQENESEDQEEMNPFNEISAHIGLQEELASITRVNLTNSKQIVELRTKEPGENEDWPQEVTRWKKKGRRLSVQDHVFLENIRCSEHKGPSLEDELANLDEFKSEIDGLETCVENYEDDLWDTVTGKRANASDIECPFVTQASFSFTSVFGDDSLDMDLFDFVETVDDSNNTIPVLIEGSSMPSTEKGRRTTIFDFLPSSSNFWSPKVLIAGCILVAAISTANVFRRG